MTDNLILAYALILLGLVLLVAELFIPTFGVLAALSVGAIVFGLAITFANDTSIGFVTLVAVFIIAPALLTAVFNYAPKTRFGRRLFLTGPEEDETVANMPVNLELEQLRGRYGKTVSALRPSGTVDFDGRRVDVLSEGALIEPGQWVRCMDVKAGRVIVREVDKPPDLGNLDTAIFT
jgi:membrane-bound ClpP family serine protease